MNLRRRAFVAGMLASVVARSAQGALPRIQDALDDLQALREIAFAKGIHIGAAVSSDQLRLDPSFRTEVVKECSLVVPEWQAKWTALRPSAVQFDFSGFDALIKQAGAHGLAVRGHPLIWHAAMPEWAAHEIQTGDAKWLLEQHIATTAARYRGKVVAWDVVNEAIRPEDGMQNGLRDTPWCRALGPGYIATAFRCAAEFDPGARLVYNDYNVEYDDRRADAILNLVKRLRDDGVPVHAVGLQSHLWATGKQLRPRTVKRFCRAIQREGLDVLITELDIRETDHSADVASRDRIVADVTEVYLDAVLSECVPKEITFWGLSDKYSWLSKPKYNPENPDGNLNRGLPLDQNLRRKPLWYAVAKKLSEIR